MALSIIAIIIFVSLIALAKVMRDVSREISGLDEASKSPQERRDAAAQQRMADRKLTKELAKWREGK